MKCLFFFDSFSLNMLQVDIGDVKRGVYTCKERTICCVVNAQISQALLVILANNLNRLDQ